MKFIIFFLLGVMAGILILWQAEQWSEKYKNYMATKTFQVEFAGAGCDARQMKR